MNEFLNRLQSRVAMFKRAALQLKREKQGLRDEVERLTALNENMRAEFRTFISTKSEMIDNALYLHRRVNELDRLLAVMVSRVTGKSVITPNMKTFQEVELAVKVFAKEQQVKALEEFIWPYENGETYEYVKGGYGKLVAKAARMHIKELHAADADRSVS